MIYFRKPQFPARYRIDGVDLYDVHELNRHGQMLQELALSDMAKREWVGLESDEQILEISKDAWGKDKLNRGRDDHRSFYIAFARAVEAKLKERNT